MDKMFNRPKRTLKSLRNRTKPRRDINGEPIFDIEPSDFIFDLLHTEENITRSVAFDLDELLTCSSQLIGGTASLILPNYQPDFDAVFSSIRGIRTRVKDAESKRGTDEWWKSYRGLQLNRNESLEVLGNYEIFLAVLNRQQSTLAEAQPVLSTQLMRVYLDTEFIWNQFRQFIVFFSCSSVDMSKLENWNDKMKSWLTKYIDTFRSNQVTTYIHMMVCHSRECLEKCGSLQRFANFALESKHVLTKEIFHNQTNRRSLEARNILKYSILSESFVFPVNHKNKRKIWHDRYSEALDKDLKNAINRVL